MITFKRRQAEQYKGNQIDLEANLALAIAKTGQVQIKKRRKAGFSVYFLKDGHLIEQKPDQSVVKKKIIAAKWVVLDKNKRRFTLK